MIVDTSALVATILAEADADQYMTAMLRAETVRMSAVTYVETGIVVDARRRDDLSREVDRLIEDIPIAVVPFTPRQATFARLAYRDYGRGSGHPAKLNFGDCMSYALAIDTGEDLLFKGDDFTHTDVRPAL